MLVAAFTAVHSAATRKDIMRCYAGLEKIKVVIATIVIGIKSVYFTRFCIVSILTFFLALGMDTRNTTYIIILGLPRNMPAVWQVV